MVHDIQPVLEVRSLMKSFGHGPAAVDSVSFAIGPGEILAILGPSGCGKTTTLRMIAGLEEPDGGDILVRGRSVLGLPPHRRDTGLVFQDLAIFPHKTVFENVAFGLWMRRYPKDKLRSRVDEFLRLVELPPERFGARLPATLSGGERQRVALARTLVVEPAVVLFDEPMVSLDRRLRDRMAVEVRHIQKRLGLPAVYVTHDQESASTIADRIAVMQAGHIVQEGTPLEIYRHPRTRFVADFIGDTNFLRARVVRADASGTTVELGTETITVGPDDARPGASVTLAVRPEDLRLTPVRTALSLSKAVLAAWHFSGGAFLYRVTLGNGSSAVVRTQSGEFQDAGQRDLWLEADRDCIRVLKD